MLASAQRRLVTTGEGDESTVFAKRLVTAAAFVATVLLAGGVAEAETDPTNGEVVADEVAFGDGVLDLSESWGDATACAELGSTVECFATESELLDVHPELLVTAFAGQTSSQSSSCSTALRLYRGSSHGGGVLYLSTRGTWLSLSSYGFDNDTSSYRVGACSSIFRSGSGGAGSEYPGPTSAGASGSAMRSGWDNVISSVYLY